MREKTLGQFFTHPEVADFMSKIMIPTSGEHIIDPSCGDGVFLDKLHKLEPNAHLYGVEIDKDTYDIAKQQLPFANIFLHNGLYSHKLKEGDQDISKQVPSNFFDGIIANPPFNGLRNKVQEQLILELFMSSYHKNKLRKSQSVEVLFFERFIQLLKPGGRLCTILPEGVLSDERLTYIRNWIYENFNVEAIISLPKKGIFGNAYVNAVILCGHKKPVKEGKVFYVREVEVSDLPLIYEYMLRNEIFIKERV